MNVLFIYGKCLVNSKCPTNTMLQCAVEEHKQKLGIPKGRAIKSLHMYHMCKPLQATARMGEVFPENVKDPALHPPVIYVTDEPIETSLEAFKSLFLGIKKMQRLAAQVSLCYGWGDADSSAAARMLDGIRLDVVHPSVSMPAYFQFSNSGITFHVFDSLTVFIEDMSKCLSFLQERGYFEGFFGGIDGPQATSFVITIGMCKERHDADFHRHQDIAREIMHTCAVEMTNYPWIIVM